MLRHGAVATLILAVGLGSSARPREDELVVFVHGWKAGGQTVKRLLNASVGAARIASAFADDAHRLWPPGSALTQALELPRLTRAVCGGDATGVCDAIATRPCATFTMLREPRARAASAYLYCRHARPDDQLCSTALADARAVGFGSWLGAAWGGPPRAAAWPRDALPLGASVRPAGPPAAPTRAARRRRRRHRRRRAALLDARARRARARWRRARAAPARAALRGVRPDGRARPNALLDALPLAARARGTTASRAPASRRRPRERASGSSLVRAGRSAAAVAGRARLRGRGRALRGAVRRARRRRRRSPRGLVKGLARACRCAV